MMLGVEARGLWSGGFCSRKKDLMEQSETNHLYINFAVYVLVETFCGVTVGLSKQIRSNSVSTTELLVKYFSVP